MQFVREISLLLKLLICICEWSSASFSANEFGLSDIKFKLMLLMLQFSLSRESTKDFLDEMEKLLLENSFLKETFLFGELIANFLLFIFIIYYLNIVNCDNDSYIIFVVIDNILYYNSKMISHVKILTIQSNQRRKHL